MKTKVYAHIHSLNGEMKEVTILDTKINSYGEKEYIVKYNDIICTAIYNPFTGYYADDKYGIISNKKEK